MAKSKVITGKLSTPDSEKLEQYLNEHPEANKSAIVSSLVSNFLNGSTPTPGNEADTEKIRLLETAHTRLQSKITDLQQQNADLLARPDSSELQQRVVELNQEYKTLQQQVETLQTENEKLKTHPATTGKLKENQLIIDIPPSLLPFLKELATRETNRTGKRVTIQMVLLELFWKQLKDGPGDHLSRTFSQSEIKRILKQVKGEAGNE